MTDVKHDPTVHLIEAGQAIAGEVPVIAHFIFTSLLEMVLEAYESGSQNELMEKLRLEYVKASPGGYPDERSFLRIVAIDSSVSTNQSIAVSVPIKLLKGQSVTRALIQCRQRNQVMTDTSNKAVKEHRINLQKAIAMYDTYSWDVPSGMWAETFKSLRRLKVDSTACAHKHLPKKIYNAITRH